MKRLPLIPTIVVALAVAAMVGLGIWQLQRARWKEGLLARFAVARTLPSTAFPAVPPSDDALLFRRASGFCLNVTEWRAMAGRNLAGESGWRHIAACRTGAEGPGMQVDMGWSDRSTNPAWTGGRVSGVIAPDTRHRILLVSTAPAPGLQASAPPNPADVPNNHRSYAVQWFAFAAAAAIIYVLALRHRRA
jgi:surfeit locus 1 family protein